MTDDSRIGTELAGYRIESLLGWGGMSVVYVAEDQRLKRKVALKVLAAGLADDESFRDRFLRESELAASIDHPNIVPIYEAGTADDLLFIAMRYVEGRDLQARVRRGRLDPPEAIGLVAQVASALDAAHARGLVHRDVKPSNVLLDTGARPDGSDHVYLADFGLTKRIADETGLGDEGHLLGTIDYVAPEQVVGAEVDGRADVYSLGAVLFECLVGRPPFRRDSDVAVVFAHLEAEPPALTEQRPELPKALDAVVARALAKEPEQRYASCRELARQALGVAVEEANRVLVDTASRAAAGRSGLSEVEADLASKVIDLQVAREQERALAGPATPVRVAAEGICPFKGLASFEPVEADYFFGRERLVAEIVARVVGAGFLAIVGPSGSGKSSVLRAGLLPALAAGVLPGSGGWRRWLVRPGERPLEVLRTLLVSGATDPLAEVLDALPPGDRILLAIDQLEELFTACRSESQRASFTDALVRAATDPQGRALVVVALRADFYGRFAAQPRLAELLAANHVLVGPMQASELRRAVELPAARVGLRVEPELTDALVDDLEGEPGALPLLSTALLELWQNRRENTLTLGAYRESGGVHGAVARLAERTYAQVPDERRSFVRALMLRLVGEDEGDAPVRRRAALAELDLERDPWTADVLATLADNRLVTVGEGSVEVAHEALLSEWPRLRNWIEEDADGRRLRRHITHAATEWHAGGRDAGELYRGARLAATLDWSTDHALELNDLESEFVAESRRAWERETRRARRTNRRLRALLAVVALLLVAAIAGGGFALVQRGEARDAETAQLAQRLGAQALVEEDLALSLLLARQAVAVDDTPQTRSNLFATLLRAPAATSVMHGGDDALIWGVALRPDGGTLAVIDFFGKLRLFDAATRAEIGTPPNLAWIESVAYSLDGTRLALGGERYVRIVDARTREILKETYVAGRAARLAYTRDGSQLVVVVDHSIVVLDPQTLGTIGPTIKLDGFRLSNINAYYRPPHFALTPDGRSVVTASDAGELAWWDLRSRRKTRTLRIAGGHHAVAIAGDGLTAAVGIGGGIQLVDVRTGALTTVTAGFAGSPNGLQFSPDGKTVASANLDGTITLLDVRRLRPRETLRGHANAVRQLVFGSDGKTLYSASDDGTAIAWDLSGRQRLERPFTFTHDRDFDEGDDRHPGRFSPDGRLLAVGLKERGVAFLDANELTPVGAPLLDTGGEVKAIAFSSDGGTLATMGRQGTTTFWDVASRSKGVEVQGGGFGASVRFSPDGSLVATNGSGGGLDFWSASTGASLGRVAPFAWTSDVSFSGDGALVAFANTGSGHARAEVWDVARRVLVAALSSGTGDALCVALSRDGTLLAVGGYGTVVRIWDVRTQRVVRELEHGGGGAVSLAFSADGRRLAVAGFEPTASLWDVATGTRIGPNLTTGGRTAMVDLSADGRRLLLTTASGEGAVWDIDPSSWARRACAVANRRLTRKEWQKFLPGRRYEPACTT